MLKILMSFVFLLLISLAVADLPKSILGGLSLAFGVGIITWMTIAACRK